MQHPCPAVTLFNLHARALKLQTNPAPPEFFIRICSPCDYSRTSHSFHVTLRALKGSDNIEGVIFRGTQPADIAGAHVKTWLRVTINKVFELLLSTMITYTSFSFILCVLECNCWLHEIWQSSWSYFCASNTTASR